MTDRLPPFKSIEAFVVAARACSFTEAAATLNITVPAVSRRIQALEAELAVALFRRASRNLTLTRCGEAYLLRLAPALDAIRGASECIRGEARRNSVKISLPPSFAAAWLVPRLPSFHAQHRDIRIELQSRIGCVDINEIDVDLAIQCGNGDWPTARAERLLDVEAFPVCSVEFLNTSFRPGSPSELAKCPLLALSVKPDLWLEWFRALGVSEPLRTVHSFDQFHLLYQAAASGLGVALGLDVTAGHYLDDDRLVRPLDASVTLAESFFLVGRPTDRVRRPVATFRSWLLDEAAAWRARMARDRRGRNTPQPVMQFARL